MGGTEAESEGKGNVEVLNILWWHKREDVAAVCWQKKENVDAGIKLIGDDRRRPSVRSFGNGVAGRRNGEANHNFSFANWDITARDFIKRQDE